MTTPEPHAAQWPQAAPLRVVEKMSAVGELVAGMTHELNNPLTGISALAQMLLEEPLTAEQLEFVRLIKLEADRATAVVRDLMRFARQGDHTVGPVDVGELVAHTLRLRAYTLRKHGIDVHVDIPRDVPRITGNANTLQQVLISLIANAEDAMVGRPARTLTVNGRAGGTDVVLEIGDTGAGIPPAVQARMFEPFFTTKPEGQGTGLGLSAAYGIVRAHGGNLAVFSSDVGVGTTLRLTLPCVPPS